MKELAFEDVESFFENNQTIYFSGFAGAGAPKVIPGIISNKIDRLKHTKNNFVLNLISSASTGITTDGVLAKQSAIKFRTPFQSDPTLRTQINDGLVSYCDISLSKLTKEIDRKTIPEIDIAVIEVSKIDDNGKVTLSTSVGITPLIINIAKKIILEVNGIYSDSLSGLHDLTNISYSSIVSLSQADERLGETNISIPSNKILGFIKTNEPDNISKYQNQNNFAEIAQNIEYFIKNEISECKIDASNIVLQSGIGHLPNFVLRYLGECTELAPFSMYSEVIQDSVIDLIKNGKVRFASGCALMITNSKMEEILQDRATFINKIILRSQDITNRSEIIRSLNIIAINSAVEVDLFGNVNSSHVNGTQIINGIGGSADFSNSALVSIFILPSVVKNNTISKIVPMVTHCDHTEHSVDVLVTEQGIADLRGLSPRQRAHRIISNCVHPDYKELLTEYISMQNGKSHTPHTLKYAFMMHETYKLHKDMRKTCYNSGGNKSE